MPGTYSDFWRLVRPAPSKTRYSASGTEAAKLYNNYSWYNKVVKGASTRFSKYTQYKNMDNDVFVNRALDTIAEEMTTVSVRTQLPFEIEYQTESDAEVPENVTMTVRAALRHWCELQSLDTALFDIARDTVKFGDCFLRKTSDFKRWRYLDPGDIIGISVNAETGAVEHYHLRYGDKDRNQAGALGEVQLVPAAGVVHFSLSSQLGVNGPFGESVLAPCVKAFRHLSLLEDSVIIYRIVRAPERRVFFLDTGSMPPQRVKAYLEAIKNEVRQKRIPNETGGQEKIDSVFNPMSMCLSLDTEVPLLDGRTLKLQELIKEHEAGAENWVYSCDPVTGRVVPGPVSWAGVTRKNAEVIRLTLDNGEQQTCTPDHMIPVLGRGKVRADQLTPEMSLISFERRVEQLDGAGEYEQVFDHELNEWVWTHRIVGRYMSAHGEPNELRYKHVGPIKAAKVIHHVDFNRFNNSPKNLATMNYSDHFKYHSDHGRFPGNQRLKVSDELFELFRGFVKLGGYHLKATLKLAEGDPVFMSLYRELNKKDPHKGSKIKGTIIHDKFLRLIYKQYHYANWKHLARSLMLDDADNEYGRTVNSMVVTPEMVGKLIPHVISAGGDQGKALDLANSDTELKSLVQSYNPKDHRRVSKSIRAKVKVIDRRFLYSLYYQHGYGGWKHLTECASTYNHRITSIEVLAEKQDVGCLTIDRDEKYHGHHSFAVKSGIFVGNCEDYFFSVGTDGRGSKVETLPGGENLGQIEDLNFFQSKFLQGLRIPTSYMRGGAEGGIAISDGKVGVAYVEELRFANYVARLQTKINGTFDDHFKAYLKSADIKVDPQLFFLRLCDPQSFKDFKQAEVDEKLISNYSNVKDVKSMAERFRLKYYLGLNEDELQENEVLLRQERNIPEDGIDEGLNALRMIYDPKWDESRPDIKVDASYDDHTAATSQAKGEDADAEEEAPPDEAAPEGEEPDEGGGAGGGAPEKGEPEAAPEKGKAAEPAAEPAAGAAPETKPAPEAKAA